MKKSVRYQGVITFITLALPLIVEAREWYAKPSASLRSEYDDNILLLADKVPGVFGVIGALQGSAGVRNERSSVALSAGLDIYQYWGQKNLDRENFNFGLDSSAAISERHRLGLEVGYISDTSLTSEALTTGVFGTANGQVGREQVTVNPSWSYSLSEAQFIKTEYTHQEVTYQKSNLAFLNSYQTDSGNMSFNQQWSSALKYFAALGGMRYQLEGNNTIIDNYSLNVGFDYKYSETLSFNATVGGRYTINDIPAKTFDPNTFQISSETKSDSALGSLFALGIDKQFEVANLKFSYSRNTNPTAAGVLLQADSINADSEYQLSQQLKLMLASTISFNSSTSSQNTVYNRDYYMIEPKLGWAFNRQTNLVGGYRYRTQQYTSSNISADSNTFFVYLNYQWDNFTSNAF